MVGCGRAARGWRTFAFIAPASPTPATTKCATDISSISLSAGRFCLIPTATIALSLFPGARLVSTGGFIRQADAWESIWAVSESREAFRDERVCSKLSCSRQEAFEPVGQKQPGTWHGFVASQVRYPTEAEDTCLHQI